MGIEPAHPTIRRHFVTVNGERQVHYRRAGKGPVVVLLHQSPTSSREHVPLIERLMNEFTVIAPDTPGNGLSDPLPGDQPLAEEYAHALAQTLEALGIERCGVFGSPELQRWASLHLPYGAKRVEPPPVVTFVDYSVDAC